MPSPVLELVESGPLRYLVSTPVAAARTSAPVLCFLHGYDEAAPIPIEHALTLHGPLASSADRAARERFLIVAPQLPRAGDVWHRAADDVVAILDEATQRYGGNRERWLLTGFSFGGNGVFDLALANPGRWRALWAVDPTRVPSSPLGDTPIWLSIGAAARGQTAEFIARLELMRAAPRGANPGPVPDESRLHVDERLDHVASAGSAYADARIYDWLWKWATHRVGGADRDAHT